jgi:hypothetical protein
VLRDWDGNEVKRGKQAASVPAKCEAAEFNLPILKIEV